MDLGRGYYRPYKGKVTGMNHFPGVKIGLSHDALLIIKLPDSHALRIMSRSLFLAMVLLTLPSIGSILRGSVDVIDVITDDRNFNMLHNLVHDLVDEGLVKRGHKGIIFSSENDRLAEDLDLTENVVDLVIDSDVGRKNSVPNEKMDFAIAWSAWNGEFIDRVLKVGGIVVTQLSNDPIAELKALANYRIVYIRKFDKTVIGMRKTGIVNDEVNSGKKNILCGTTPEEKKVALKGLEDVLLEPPRKESVKYTSRKMKFLPELLGDSLENYPRRVFISDEKNGMVEWFQRNYPANNQDFEIYSLGFSDDSEEKEEEVPIVGAAEWLSKNVKEDDYVVMKAEAQVVEEMIKKKTICLVDELFLHCESNQSDDYDIDVEEGNGSKRAYWQCLTLYGKLIDEGVAVHQWWS